jgi:hypothetical protein
MPLGRAFGETFTPLQWQGVRARQFSDGADAFQQLVGDALRNSFREAAVVSPTRGKDGGIDAWVRNGYALPSRFRDFSMPLIVECKQHDAASSGLARNIEQGWDRVASKLASKAAAGWPGDYATWKDARGYLYCVSVRFRTPAEREALEARIRAFFTGLPDEQRPPIAPPQIRVWDWGDLAHWFRESGRLADEWLGLDWPDLVDHASYRARIGQMLDGRLQSFRGYLLEEHLPFVTPDTGDAVHPEQLLSRLTQGENLILLGEVGIGKTRTTFEVAERAATAHWRVLHLNPSEQGIDLRSMAKELLRHAGETLAVVDYIDQFQHFDARFWYTTLLPEAAARGARIALLANARPAGSTQALSVLQESGLFSTLVMAPTPERRQRVTGMIEDRLCPTAIVVLGREQVRELCGPRPIIAMFIGRELESLARTGALNAALATAIRPGDLMSWVSRRLREAGLVAAPQSVPWDSVSMAPGLCAATAVLAAAPMFEVDLVAVASATLAERPGGDAAAAPRIVAALRQAGWLEPGDRSEWRTPHDAVADEALRRLLGADLGLLPALLASAPSGKPLGRFAVSLGRLVGSADASAEVISAAAAEWLRQQASAIGARLAAIESDFAAYALGGVFDCPPWIEVALRTWQQLVQPWIDAHGTELSARHLLHRGLKRLTAEDSAHMLTPARAWLVKHGETPDAGFVLDPLLGWSAERLGDAQGEVLSRAREWLEKHRETPDAGFVLGPLLGWSEARLGDAQGEVLSRARQWLEKHRETRNVKFLLAALLGWSAGRLGNAQGEVLSRARQWLEKHRETVEVEFVLHPLLGWSAERLGDAQGEVLSRAREWLEKHRKTVEVQFVLHPLLRWSAERLGDAQGEVLRRAREWLEKHGETPDAGFVLGPLLGWSEARLGDAQGEVLSRARQWLEKHRETPNAGFLLAALLGWSVERLGNARGEVLSRARKWLEKHAEAHQAEYVLSHILSQPKVAAAQRQIWASRALSLAREREAIGEETHLLKALLQVAGRYPDDVPASDIVRFAGEWLDRHPTHPEKGFVFARLLRLEWLPDDAWAAVANAAVVLLCSRPSAHDDDYLLNGVLTRIGALAPVQVSLWLESACSWLQNCRKKPDAFSLLVNVKKISSSAVCASLRGPLDAAFRARFPSEPPFD